MQAPVALLTISEWIYAIVMAIVQGATEFIPVSSSGHMAIISYIAHVPEPIDFIFFLHIPSLIAAVIYFREDIRDFTLSWLPKNAEEMAPQRRVTIFLVVAMLVTGPIGLAFSGRLDEFSTSLLVLGAMFIVTALMLVSSEYMLARAELTRSMDKLTPARAAIIGLVQGLAVIPGISRSGSTIAAGLWVGLSRPQAARFSFLLSIPVVIAGSLRDIVRLFQGDLVLPSFWISAVSFVIAGVVSYLVIAWMIRLVSKTNLNWFAVYATLLGIVLIVLHFAG